MNTGRKLAAAVAAEAAPRYLYWWLLLAVFFEYARPAAFVPGIEAFKLNSLIPLSLLVLCVFARGLRPVEDIIGDPLAKWLLIYFALIALSMVHGTVKLYAYNKFIQVLGYLFLFFIIVRIVTSNQRLIGVFMILIAAHLFLLWINPAVLLNPEQRSYIQGGSFLGDGNDFGLSLCILLPMAIALALNARSKWRRLLWWSTLTLLMLAIIGTSSRGATLGLIAVGGYLWLISPRKTLTLIAFAFAVAIVLAFAPDSYFQRMNTIGTYEEDGSAMGRIDAWKAALRMVAINPLLGVGAGNFPTEVWRYKPPGSSLVGELTAHSMYFLVLGELGFSGIVALLMLVIGGIRASSLLRRHLLATAMPAGDRRRVESARLLYLLNASMVGLAVPGAFLSAPYYPHLFVLTGLMVSCRCIARGMVAGDASVTHELEKPLHPRQVQS